MDELIEQMGNLLDEFQTVKLLLRQYDKNLFERWKAGGYDVSGEFVSMYPSVDEILEQLEEQRDTESDEE